MTDFTLSLWEGWIGTKRWMSVRAWQMLIAVLFIALMWGLRVLSFGFVGVVVGVIVSEPLADIAVFIMPLPKVLQYIMITLFDIVRMAVVAFLMTAILFVPPCYDYTTVWCGSKYQIIQLSMMVVIVASHTVMVIISWRRSLAPPPAEPQP